MADTGSVFDIPTGSLGQVAWLDETSAGSSREVVNPIHSQGGVGGLTQVVQMRTFDATLVNTPRLRHRSIRSRRDWKNPYDFLFWAESSWILIVHWNLRWTIIPQWYCYRAEDLKGSMEILWSYALESDFETGSQINGTSKFICAIRRVWRRVFQSDVSLAKSVSVFVFPLVIAWRPSLHQIR